MPCGFIHLPYMPEQVAGMIAEAQADRSVERQRRTDVPSMSLDLMADAVRIALEVTLAQTARRADALETRLPGTAT
jgi:pyroglutamyl-peptidase